MKKIKQEEFKLNSIIGIDLGIKNIVTTSDGIKYDAMPYIRKIEHKDFIN